MKRYFYFKKLFPILRLVEIFRCDTKSVTSYMVGSLDGCKLSRCFNPRSVCKDCSYVLRLTL